MNMANQMSRSGEPRGPKAWRISSSKALKLLRRVEIQVRLWNRVKSRGPRAA